MGWKHSEAVAELEANRKTKAAEYYATKKKQLALLAKAAAKVGALHSSSLLAALTNTAVLSLQRGPGRRGRLPCLPFYGPLRGSHQAVY